MGGVEGADRLIQEIKAMSKMSKIDQIHLRAVMLCMSKMSKMQCIEYCTKDAMSKKDRSYT